ncbi:MAG: LysM peptidoglycan-binding domain-containing protein, partial [Chloroflexi bacterium]|nr:LysM peptidoglycan-binding domain-containing protein [Chloroflexota bacterium]
MLRQWRITLTAVCFTATLIGLLAQGANVAAEDEQSQANPAATFDTYIVQSGDSLYSLAQRFNTTVEALAATNNIIDTGQLYAGQSILVPTGASSYVEVYEVQPGDTLFSISKRFNTSAGLLQGLNDIADGRSIFAGQILTVPSVNQEKLKIHVVGPDESLYSIARRYNTTVSVLTSLNGIGGRLDLAVGRSILVPKIDERVFEIVVVQSGESLFGIAQRYGVSVASLQALNRLPDPRDIRVNQAILVPKLGNMVLEVHIVQRGDNLTKIAEAYNTTVEFLQLLNSITDPGLIQLDDSILVPGSAYAPARPGFGYGIQVFTDQDVAGALAERVSQLGVDWVKIDVPWEEIEVQQGVYDYAALDATVAAMEHVDVNILLNVFAAPAWSRTSYTEKLNSQLRDYGGPPEDLNDFATFMANLATRYAGIVDAYEIWKSPNLLRYWTIPVYKREPELNADGDYGIPDEVHLGAQFYVPLLKIGYETIKSHDEEALVISGGLAPVGFSDGYNSIHTGKYLQEMLEGGAADYSDAIGAAFGASAVPPTLKCCDKPPGVDSHYESFLQYFPELMEFYAEVLTENDLAGTPIIVTQVGWGTREGANI